MNRNISASGNLGILCVVLLLSVGCAGTGPLPSVGDRPAVDAIEKDDPEKSYGEILLERTAEGNFKRRVIGWIDRAT